MILPDGISELMTDAGKALNNSIENQLIFQMV